MRVAVVIFFLVGACIIALGAVWLTVASPRLEKLPADFAREDTFSGTYQVLNPATGQLDEMSVTLRRTRETVYTEGDYAFITERVTTTLPTGEPLPQFPPAEANLDVDRVTRLYQRGPLYATGQRYGGMDFPTDVKRDVVYPMWVDATEEALPARYNGSTKIDGLEVYRFIVDVQDSELPADPESGLPRVSDVRIEYQVEPRSSRTVDMTSQVTISLVDPEEGKTPLFISTISFTDDSVARAISDAKTARIKLILLGSYVPWLVMGLGMLFGLYSMLLYGVFRWRGMGTA